MWKDWKKRVSDFFFEDVPDQEEEKTVKRKIPEIKQRPSVVNKNINARVAYKYPKEAKPPHRTALEEKIQIPTTNRSGTNRNVQRTIPNKNEQDFSHNIDTQRDEKIDKGQQNIEQAQRKKKEKPVFMYTRPEELDRIFKISEGKLVEPKEMTQKDIQKTPKQVSPPVSPSFVNEAEKEVAAVLEQQEEKVILKEAPTETPIENTVFSTTDEAAMAVHHQLETVEEVETEVPGHLLNDPVEPAADDATWLREQQSLLEQTLMHFNVDAKIVNVTQGPSVTRFEIQPALGVKVSRIRNLSDDIKLNMAAKDIRIEAPIPGKNTIGIEVPNQYPKVVSLQEIIETDAFEEAKSPLTIALGLTIEGEPLITDIGKMPHGLIAGATGSGKSVCINTILLSLLYKANHHEVKFLLIDPKMVELTPYNGIPHLIAPVITDAKAATMSLKWAVEEMENRYERFVASGVRNIEKYNEKAVKENRLADKMPYIVIVIDELADLMMVSPQEVEDAICRIAQKARACGIHLLLATQRPSVDVITGLIKANIPTRIAFSVSSQVDSRTMIDSVGAEKLLGKGDMLFVENGASKSVRLQGPFVSDDEIDRVANYMRTVAEPNYLFEQEQLLLDLHEEEEDELLEEVIAFVIDHHQASTSLLQRRFRIGYNRAARLIDTLENKGVISAQNGSKPREVLVTKSQLEELF